MYLILSKVRSKLCLLIEKLWDIALRKLPRTSCEQLTLVFAINVSTSSNISKYVSTSTQSAIKLWDIAIHKLPKMKM